MAKQDPYDEDELSELIWIDPSRIDGVRNPASGTPFLLVKSVGQSAAVKRPKKGRKTASKRASLKRAAKAGRMVAGSYEVPACGPGEADSILRALTGEGGKTCGARTADGTPCQRPSVGGGMCHHHGR